MRSEEEIREARYGAGGTTIALTREREMQIIMQWRREIRDAALEECERVAIGYLPDGIASDVLRGIRALKSRPEKMEEEPDAKQR